LTNEVTAKVNGEQVTVTYPTGWGTGAEKATYDLSVPEEYVVFAELQYAHSLAGRLNVVGPLHALVEDDTPDMFSLTFSSLTGLIEKYGRESPEVNGAVHLIDAALPKLVQSFSSLYPGRMATEVVLLGSHDSVLQAVDHRAVVDHIHQLMPSQKGVMEFFPYLYVDPAHAPQLSQVCDVMSLKLQEQGFSVYCPQAQSAFAPAVRFSTFAVGAPGNSTFPTYNEINLYQIELWVSLAGVFVVGWAVYTIGWMTFKKDTLLYSTFNPNWEGDRKRQ